MPSSTKPVFILVPGAAQTPSHYAYLQHLLLSHGYGVSSALLPLFQDVSPVLAEAAILSAVSHCLTAFKSPCPVASWNEQAYRGRCAYIQTLDDQALPYEVQNMIIKGTEQEWLIRDIETGHCPHLAAPDNLSTMIIELAQHFEVM